MFVGVEFGIRVGGRFYLNYNLILLGIGHKVNALINMIPGLKEINVKFYIK